MARVWPFGSHPADALLRKNGIAPYTPEGGLEGDIDYRDYARGVLTDKRCDPDFLASDSPPGAAHAAHREAMLNLFAGGTRGSRAEGPRHPELFLADTENDPRGTLEGPRLDLARYHFLVRRNEYTARMSDNSGPDGEGNTGHDEPERAQTHASLDRAYQESRALYRSKLRVFTPERVAAPNPSARPVTVLAGARGGGGRVAVPPAAPGLGGLDLAPVPRRAGDPAWSAGAAPPSHRRAGPAAGPGPAGLGPAAQRGLPVPRVARATADGDAVPAPVFAEAPRAAPRPLTFVAPAADADQEWGPMASAAAVRGLAWGQQGRAAVPAPSMDALLPGEWETAAAGRSGRLEVARPPPADTAALAGAWGESVPAPVRAVRPAGPPLGAAVPGSDARWRSEGAAAPRPAPRPGLVGRQPPLRGSAPEAQGGPKWA